MANYEDTEVTRVQNAATQLMTFVGLFTEIVVVLAYSTGVKCTCSNAKGLTLEAFFYVFWAPILCQQTLRAKERAVF